MEILRAHQVEELVTLLILIPTRPGKLTVHVDDSSRSGSVSIDDFTIEVRGAFPQCVLVNAVVVQGGFLEVTCSIRQSKLSVDFHTNDGKKKRLQRFLSIVQLQEDGPHPFGLR